MSEMDGKPLRRWMITKGSWLQKDALPYGRRITITSAFSIHKAESHGCRNLEFSEGHKKKTRRSITPLESWANWDNAPIRRVLFHQELERDGTGAGAYTCGHVA